MSPLVRLISPLWVSALVVFALVGCQAKATKTGAATEDTTAATENKAPVTQDSERPLTATFDALKPAGKPEIVGIEVFAPTAYVAKQIASHDTENYYGLYMAGRKAGFARVGTRKTTEGEPGGFMTSLRAQLKADGDTIEFAELSFYESNPPYRLVAVDTLQQSSTGSVLRQLRLDGDKTIVTSIVDGKNKTEFEAPPLCGSLFEHFAELAPKMGNLKENMQVEYCSYDSSDHKQKASLLRVRSLETRKLNGVSVKVVALDSKDIDESGWTTAFVTEEGITLEVSITGIILKLQDKRVAQSSVIGVDALSLSVKADRRIGDPSKVEELNMVVGLAESFVLSSAPNQEASKRPDGRYDVTIRAIPGARVTKKERDMALLATANVDSGNAAIVEQAKIVVAGSATPREKVTALNHWVYENLKKSLSTNLSTASQVLDHRTGDCTEHTVLLVALLRAIGIPAREVSGVMYMGDDYMAFGWHAWVEVELDGHWVQVDPSWDEPVSNATHLKLGAGESDEGMNNLGALTLEII